MKKSLTVIAAILLLFSIFLGILFLINNGSIFQEEVSYSSQVKKVVTQFIGTPKQTIEILFVGDMNFDRYIRLMAKKHGGPEWIFSCIDPLLKEADMVVGNLEGPITANASVSENSKIGAPENFRFTFPTTTASLLFDHNIKIVNIGNNHIGDFGREGIASTRKFLTDAGVAYFGGLAGDSPVYRHVFPKVSFPRSIRAEQGEFAISLVNYNQFGGDSPETVAEKISVEHEQGNVVVVYTHWGEEYVEPTEHMRSTAALFAHSGADLIIGSHPHVVQSHEMIGDTIVYYSLGNFIFDQYWNDSVSHGLALLVRISKVDADDTDAGPSDDGTVIIVEEKPVVMSRDGRTCEI
jgi:poly-gamma-glutamate synthesis protein (capsule biosynthesis protein)